MARQAFEGIKVADFGWIWAGPLVVKYLADHGAEVIRVESRTRPDAARTTAPYKDGIAGLNRSGAFTICNANKYGVTLNLNHRQGLEVAKRIVAWADIVSEGFSPGTMEKWGLGYNDLKKIKPDIIMISSSNLGQTGPRGRFAGFGTQLTSLAGFVEFTGWPDRGPALPYGAQTDIITPRFGAAALIAALDYRRRTGRGQYIDVSQYEASLQFLAVPILDFTVNSRASTREGNKCPYAAPHGAYRCKGGEDEWCVIAVFTDAEWGGFCDAIGNPDWVRDPKFGTLLNRKENEDELDKHVQEWTTKFTAREVAQIMQNAGVAAGVVYTLQDLYEDPQLQYRKYFWRLEHQEIGEHYYAGHGFRLSKTPEELRLAAPCLGQHNEYVYTKILGMSDEEFVELTQAGAFD